MTRPNLQASSKTLEGLALRLVEAKGRTRAIQQWIDQHGPMPLLTLGGVGEVARHRYNNKCAEVGSNCGALVSDVDSSIEALHGNMKAYAEGDQSIIESTRKALDHEAARNLHTLYSWRRPHIGADNPGGLMVIPLAVSALVSTQLVDAGRHGREAAARAASSGGPRPTKLAEITQNAHRALSVCGRLSLTVLAAEALWAVSALVTSDDRIDDAIVSWAAVENESYALKYNLQEAIDITAGGGDENAAWIGEAGNRARHQIEDSLISADAILEDARRTRYGLINLVNKLYDIYQYALWFTVAQTALIAGLGLASLVFPAARALAEYLGSAVYTVILITINAAALVVGAFWAAHSFDDGSVSA